MTDKEIKKGLECCIEWETPEDCGKCPYKDAKGCVTAQRKDALDLINRQQETIETLRKCVEQHHIIRKDGKSPLSLLTAEIRAEAIKEFAERLIMNVTINNTNDGYLDYAVDYNCLIEDIQDLVKEMVGEDK